MRKGIKVSIMILVLLLTVILGLTSYFFIWGGKPHIKNFEEVSDEYEIVAQFALAAYRERKLYDSYPENDLIIIDIYEDKLASNDFCLSLSEEQKNAVLTVGKKFHYLGVYEDAVFFHADETGYYGLVYSKRPLAALYKAEFPQEGREYHRINNRWYEWGVWGI